MGVLDRLLRRRRFAPLVWESQMHDDEPRDQQTDLAGHYWAAIGPDGRPRAGIGGWSWSIFYFGHSGNLDVADGFAPDERAAKDAVDEWRRTNPMPDLEPDIPNPAPSGAEGT